MTFGNCVSYTRVSFTRVSFTRVSRDTRFQRLSLLGYPDTFVLKLRYSLARRAEQQLPVPSGTGNRDHGKTYAALWAERSQLQNTLARTETIGMQTPR